MAGELHFSRRTRDICHPRDRTTYTPGGATPSRETSTANATASTRYRRPFDELGSTLAAGLHTAEPRELRSRDQWETGYAHVLRGVHCSSACDSAFLSAAFGWAHNVWPTCVRAAYYATWPHQSRRRQSHEVGPRMLNGAPRQPASVWIGACVPLKAADV